MNVLCGPGRRWEVSGKNPCHVFRVRTDHPARSYGKKKIAVMRILTLVLFASVFWMGCDSSSSGDENVPLSFRVVLDVDGLQPMSNAFQYQLWALTEDGFVGSNQFNVGADGRFVNPLGQVVSNTLNMQANVAGAETLFLVINGKGDSPVVPSGKRLLGGSLNGGSASLSLSHEEGFGVDFSNAAGQFVIATPTDSDPSNENSGVWFGTRSGTGEAFEPSLVLPDLPSGWIYEGFVQLVDGTTLRTGTFSRVDRVDDEALFFDGDSPVVPGEDFLVNAPVGVSFPVDLSGATVFITVELVEDDDDLTPSSVRVLTANVPSGSDGTPITLQRVSPMLSGTATLN
ncbi:MAG: hypothetical protein COV99_08540 [Bacteroidetes bacterium CG12_big_fil_rev_8_21_14_0_65_60_17]|nr:MAG: hypothetical protein COV99_08540 [Bacteroidetes bacterium CG12_big_fil_rev_8_21_14_0_65_60_17]